MSKILLRQASILDANNNCRVRDILVEDQRIAGVADEIRDASADQVLNLSGYTVIPGLVNAHTHIHCAHDYTDEKFHSMAAAGICLCHDLGFLVNDPLEQMMKKVQSTNADPDYPQMDVAGRYIAVKGGYGDTIPGGFQVGELVTSEEECAKAVDYLADSGSNCIKIGLDIGRGRTLETAIIMPDSFIQTIAQKAKERNLRLCAHVHEEVYLEKLVEDGITEASHIVRQPIPEDLMQEMLEKNINQVSTLTNFYRHKDRYSAEDLHDCVVNVEKYYEAGGTVAIGTDFMWPFEEYLLPLEEMRLFRKTDLTTQDIIKCATLNGARICNREADYGTIEAGKYACLLAVPGELDEQFTSLEHPSLVINRGKILVNDIR